MAEPESGTVPSYDDVWGFINPQSPLGRQIIARRGQPLPPPRGAAPVEAPSPLSPTAPPIGATERYGPNAGVPFAPAPTLEPTAPAAPPDLSFLFPGPDESGAAQETVDAFISGVPTGIDMSRVRAMFELAETPQEQAMLQDMLADIDARTTAGTQALQIGWDEVVQSNQSAATRAAEMALQAGPRAAQVWKDMANSAMQIASARTQALAEFGGRQRVNLDPASGVDDFVSFMMAQAPRAMQTAERLGMISAEQIAESARRAQQVGQAFQGDLLRTSLQLAAGAAADHNRRVQERVASERATLAGMEFQASAQNAQLAQQAALERARLAAARPEESGRVIDQFYDDVRRVAFDGPLAAQALAGQYGISVEEAQSWMSEARAGRLGRLREEAQAQVVE